MREVTISASDSGQRLNKYLMKYMKLAPSSFIYKMLRKKNILLNGKKASGNEILEENDTVKLFLSDETIENFSVHNANSSVTKSTKCPSLKILYKDADIMAVHKPSGVLSQKAKDSDYSLNEMIIDYCLHNNIIDNNSLKTFTPSVCNRLDRNTSGIVLAGISLHGSQYLSATMKDRTAEKYYYTIINGEMKHEIHDIAYIERDEKSLKSTVVSEGNKIEGKKYQKIETAFYPLATNGNITFLKAKLITGKTHQLRAHLKYLGYPIIGDAKYNKSTNNSYFREKYGLNSHLLHAGYVKLDDIIIEDELPKIFFDIKKGEKI